MDPSGVIELGREALLLTLLICAPLLGVALLVGVLIGLLQAVTQVQDQTVSFVPKLLAMMVTLTLALPWILAQLMQYAKELFEGIVTRL